MDTLSVSPDSIVSNSPAFVSLEDPQRDAWSKPAKVLEFMGDLHGKTLVDIGAGSGYFTYFFAQTNCQKVISVDIDEQFLAYINDRKQELDSGHKIETRLGEVQGPPLSVGEADVITLVNTSYYIQDLSGYFTHLHAALSASGVLYIIDFNQETEAALPQHPYISQAKVREALKNAGFSRISIDTQLLPYQYIAVAKKVK
ncbi:methyltransferase domain-containing protein [Cytophagales bacterium LB-30]|uniref:Methyltransferase domain-containing protein n=1 Tax=Shiella aurantiaca TaxID=3058365 RepID=A0ABT8F697_9BACT|nr:methyltransferase domain-containing protein [Shiella aurantiaca]